jgi:hypothetical protein
MFFISSFIIVVVLVVVLAGHNKKLIVGLTFTMAFGQYATGQMPIFKSADFIAESGIPKQSAHRILRELTDEDILIVTREGKGKSPTIFRFSRLIAITETKNG